jgi:hypothetical protein
MPKRNFGFAAPAVDNPSFAAQLLVTLSAIAAGWFTYVGAMKVIFWLVLS